MNLLSFYRRNCPHCGRSSVVDINDAWIIWISDTIWECPHCEGEFTEDQTRVDDSEQP